MKRRIAVFVVCLGAVLTAAAQAEIQIEMKSAAVMSAGEIRLGELASVRAADAPVTQALAQLNLGATPLPGNVRSVGRDHVAMCLTRAGYDPAQVRWAGAEHCTVTVQTTRVSAEQIVKAARNYLLSLPVLQGDSVRVEVEQTPRDRLLAVGPEAVSLEASAGSVDRPWGRVRVFVRILAGDRTDTIVPVIFSITSRQKVLYATRAIARGDTVADNAVEMRELVLGASGDNDAYLTRSEDAAGKKAVRAIAAGSPLAASLFTEPFAIRRGESISIVVRSSHMEILTKAVAERDGFVGDIVPVKVLSTGKSLSVKVIGAGAVELPL